MLSETGVSVTYKSCVHFLDSHFRPEQELQRSPEGVRIARDPPPALLGPPKRVKAAERAQYTERDDSSAHRLARRGSPLPMLLGPDR